ncbi:unnamed protein product [Prorocentrum cordatum]|uniref:Uncharacterized protein n=1 Tax=Prorocentrum cordatum TaxID=2364126 RepID=A0ABN9S3I3_9DINO|nr:unnamed protein product [Polarella glacialis]
MPGKADEERGGGGGGGGGGETRRTSRGSPSRPQNWAMAPGAGTSKVQQGGAADGSSDTNYPQNVSAPRGQHEEATETTGTGTRAGKYHTNSTEEAEPQCRGALEGC